MKLLTSFGNVFTKPGKADLDWWKVPMAAQVEEVWRGVGGGL